MERLKTFTTITWMLVAMMAIEIGFLIWKVKPESTVIWLIIILIAITALWLARIALAVIKELKNRHKQ